MRTLDDISVGESQSLMIDYMDPSESDRFTALVERRRNAFAKLPPAERAYQRARFMADVFGFAPAPGGDRTRAYETALSLLSRDARKAAPSDMPLDLRDSLLKMRLEWAGRDPAVQWADRADRYRGSFLEQRGLGEVMIEMSLVADLNPPDEPFLWESRDEYVNLVRRLIDRQIPGWPVDAARMYDAAAEIQREGKLPTAAIAEAVRDAFAALSGEPIEFETSPETEMRDKLSMIGSNIDSMYMYDPAHHGDEPQPLITQSLAEEMEKVYFAKRYDLAGTLERRLTYLIQDADTPDSVRNFVRRQQVLKEAAGSWSAARRSGERNLGVGALERVSALLSEALDELTTKRREELGFGSPDGTGTKIAAELRLFAKEVAREAKVWSHTDLTPKELSSRLDLILGTIEEARDRAQNPLLKPHEPLRSQKFGQAFLDRMKAFSEAARGHRTGDHDGKIGITRAGDELLAAIDEELPRLRGKPDGQRLDQANLLDLILSSCEGLLSREASFSQSSEVARLREYTRLTSEFSSRLGEAFPSMDDPAGEWSSFKSDFIASLDRDQQPKFNLDFQNGLEVWKQEASRDAGPPRESLLKSSEAVLEILGEYTERIRQLEITDRMKERFDVLRRTLLETIRRRLIQT